MIEKLRVELYPRLVKSISQIDRLKVFLVVLAIAAGCGGVLYGFLLARATARPPAPMQWIEDVSYRIPVLTIEGYTEKEVVFRTDPLGIRIAMGEEILSAPPETSFRVALDERLKAAMPTGSGTVIEAKGACPFVAGTTGKYVYPAEDSRALRLKTRRCFASQEEALKAGLLVPEK